MNAPMRSLVLAGLMALVPTADAGAQFFLHNYGPWPDLPFPVFPGGGNTVPGDMARGYGFYWYGLGDYLIKSEIAGYIHDERVRMWNNYLIEVRESVMRYGGARRRLEMERNSEAQLRMLHQKRHYPRDVDVLSGVTLNLLMAELTSPWHELKGMPQGDFRVDGRLVGCLPLFSPAVGRAMRLDGADGRPVPPEYRDHVIKPNAMKFSELRADLNDARGIALKDLLEYLSVFQLRFGEASTAEQRDAYFRLHEQMRHLTTFLVLRPEGDALAGNSAVAPRPRRPNAVPARQPQP